MGWAELRAELDAWYAAGRTATLWWRDDGAADWTPALYRLVQIARAGSVPLALAVPPMAATPRLATRLAEWPRVRVLQHGYALRNHAPAHEAPSEYPALRNGTAVAGEICHGWLRISELFGKRALPVFVPPWTRMSAGLPATLALLGFNGISSLGQRASPAEDTGLAAVNVHVEVTTGWEHPGFAGAERVLDGMTAHLRARRAGAADPDEPTGLLSRHGELDGAAWAFLERLVAATANHPAVRFPAPEVIFTRPDAPARMPASA